MRPWPFYYYGGREPSFDLLAKECRRIATTRGLPIPAAQRWRAWRDSRRLTRAALYERLGAFSWLRWFWVVGVMKDGLWPVYPFVVVVIVKAVTSPSISIEPFVWTLAFAAFFVALFAVGATIGARVDRLRLAQWAADFRRIRLDWEKQLLGPNGDGQLRLAKGADGGLQFKYVGPDSKSTA